MCAFTKICVLLLATTQISVWRHRNLCGTHYGTKMTPTTICVKTKEMCENFPGKVDPPKKMCEKDNLCTDFER
jgi:hypothetical protein